MGGREGEEGAEEDREAWQDAKRSRIIIYLLAAFFSLVLSYDSSIRGAVINADGICYLQSAQALAYGTLKSAIGLCGQARWPFYIVLIHGVAQATHFSYAASAFFLNSLFSLLSVLSFIYFISLSTQSIRVLCFGAATILLAAEFNSVREYVVRDHGFWAFYLLSCICLNKFYQNLSLKFALAWSASLIVAILFRIEGSLFLLLLPFSILIFGNLKLQQRLGAFLKLHALSLMLLASLMIYTMLHPTFDGWSRLNEVQFQLMHGIGNLKTSFHTHAKALADNVLSIYAARDASIILTLMLCSWFVYSVILNVSGIYALLIIYAWMQKSISLDSPKRWTLFSYLVINLLITGIFLAENLFLSKRYLIALSLMLLVWVPFALEDIFVKHAKRRWILPTLATLVFITSLSGVFDFGYSKLYIKHSGVWLAEHAPLGAKIYTNNQQVMYFSNHFGNSIFRTSLAYDDLKYLAHDKWRKFDFLAIYVKANDTIAKKEIMDEIPLSPAHVYANKRGDQVLLYQVEQRDFK